jgi:DNA-binding response OmpR family regulator
MSSSLAWDDALRPLSPADLRNRVVDAGAAMVCAEHGSRGTPGSVTGLLHRHGWACPDAVDLDRARWLASVRRLQVIVIIGATINWTVQAVLTIRAVTTVPILVLTDVSCEAQPRLFESGADMVAVPSASEAWLIAAITTLVRRHRPNRLSLRYLECDGLRLDLVSHKVTIDGEECEMPPTEFQLLRFLMTHPQVALRHGTIIKAVWDWKYPDERNALRICVNRLRKKLGDTAAEPRFIQSLRGFGYSFVLPVSQFAADLSGSGPLAADGALHELATEFRQLRAGLFAAGRVREAASYLVTSVVRDGICDAAAVLIRDGKMLRLACQAGNTPAWQAAVGQGIPLSRGFVAADTVLSGEPRHFVNIVEMSRHYSSTAGLLKEADLPVLLSIPLTSQKLVWGHIGFGAHDGSAFTPAHLMLLEGAGYLLGALAGPDASEPAPGEQVGA